MNKYLPAISLFLLLLFSSNAQEINFVRHHKAGTIFDAKIASDFKVDCELQESKIEKRDVRKNKSFNFEGTIEILECNNNGEPLIMQLKSAKIAGKSDEAKSNELFKEGYENFTINWNGNLMETTLSNGKKSDAKELELMQLAFRPPSSQCRLNELLGAKQFFEKEKQWTLPKDYLKKISSERGFSLKDEVLSGIGIFKEKLTYKGIDCAVIEARIKINQSENFSLDYEAEIILPFDDGILPLKTKSKSVEKIKIEQMQSKPGSELAGFDQMTLVITYSVDAELKEKK